MFQSQKHVFWQALLVTILIFSLGIIAGIVLENWRSNKIENIFKNSEVDFLDMKLQSDIYSLGKFDCQSAIAENINLADRIYKEAKQLDRYERASILSDNLKIVHKKYDILRATVFFNSFRIRQKCNVTYYDVVYFYKYNDPDINLKAEESVFSRLLEELKSKKGNQILLIPIAADNNLVSVNLILNKNNITQEDLPVILINEKIKITSLSNIKDLEKYFK